MAAGNLTILEVHPLRSIVSANPLRRSVLPPRTLLLRRVIIHSTRLIYIVPQFEAEELGIGEDGEVIFEVVALLLLCRKVVGGGDSVEICDVLRDVGSSPRAVPGHTVAVPTSSIVLLAYQIKGICRYLGMLCRAHQITMS